MTDRRAPPSQSGNGYTHDDPTTDAALDWFLRLSEDRGLETSAAFLAWRDADPRHAEAFARLQRLHGAPALRHATERAAAALDDTPRRRRNAGRLWTLPRAACLAAAVALAGVWFGPDLYLDWRSDYRTAPGARLTAALPDGSRATLNTASAIALDFAEGRRHVTLLTGEAFFEVQHDPAHPFTVSSRYADVVVTGTAFAVAREAAADAVVLERGAVTVERHGTAAVATRLAPGQMVLAGAAGVSPVQPADATEALAWRDGRVVFRDRPFAAALADLARYYPGTVLLINQAFGERRVSGQYRVDDAEVAIRTLAAAVGAETLRIPGKILILR